ncbi:hypothetical protein STCU_00694 [Strigomonas culicis]|uniref:Uncharacterized protein n=1 Tax=Strigomonas culicis TaxID=28005 RepID=S9UZF1_9TRYP|nr:hypothetical protein STCU_00694 [Strigomonas culicis]|eukprot:EPY36222.1 hypothetical protein STCU_00694 [Strigomonas culicis]
MESPINPAVFRFLFHATVGSLSLATLYSVYHQKYVMSSSMRKPFNELRQKALQAKDAAGTLDVLDTILATLQSDAVKKQSASRLSAMDHGAILVRLVKLEKDGSNAEVVSRALEALLRVYGPDAEGRSRLQQLGGYRTLLTSFSEAHRQGLEELLEAIADALKALTVVDDQEITLESDVPKGTEGVYALATLPATVKMLRILDPESPVLFLSALTGIFANITMLKIGAVNVGRGTDGHSGMSFFLRLLDHPNRSVVENCVLVIRFLCRARVGQEELTEAESVRRLAEHFAVNSDPNIINSIMTVILVMAGSDKYGEKFFRNFAETDMMNTLFELWVRSADRGTRGRAETLCTVLERVKYTSEKARRLFQQYAGQIQERQQKDKAEYQRQTQQAQQNQMMQRMMLEQMGVDPSMLG